VLRKWHAELAWLPGTGLARDVLIEASDVRFASVTSGVSAPSDALRLPGLTLPGFANAHSHAFHRALRGATQVGRGSFWTWRELMYAVAARLSPDSYFELARAVYAEMALAGITCVGEFHYLHHQVGGMPYADPNAMGRALIAAAAEAGVRLTLLDTCYLSGGLSAADGIVPLAGPQLRFGDVDGEGWASRVSSFGADAHGLLGPSVRLGAALHSVRAVPPEQMGPVVSWARSVGSPLHVHLSEQVAENRACQAVYGVSPTRLLYDEEALGPRTSVVHATHVSGADAALLGSCQAFACICPTTERDLGDGLTPCSMLAGAGARLTLGSDSHAVIDMLAEARGVEYIARLADQSRGIFAASSLLEAATVAGHASLGWPDAGEIVPGAWADLVTVSLDSVRLSGGAASAPLETVVFAATAADVRYVAVGGRDVVRDGAHVLVGDVAAALRAAVAPLL
jgi:formiminoglutamate deiminase